MKIIKKGENWCAPTFTEVIVSLGLRQEWLNVTDVGVN